MNILTIVMAIFIFLELSNVIILYFKPDSRRGNGIAAFNAWEKSKEDEEVHSLIRYLVNWVAGTKLIFIGLLIIIIYTGSWTTQLLAVVVLIISIPTYFWRLHPIIKQMDSKNQISPKGYSKTLGAMIGIFVFVFIVALLIALFFVK